MRGDSSPYRLTLGRGMILCEQCHAVIHCNLFGLSAMLLSVSPDNYERTISYEAFSCDSRCRTTDDYPGGSVRR
nr:MAG TPA: HNH endonuclease [Caudoviricetes sp.]